MDGGRERDTTIKIKSIKSDGTNRRTPTQEDAAEGAGSLNKVLCSPAPLRRTADMLMHN